MNTPKDHDKFAASSALLALVAGGSAIFAALFIIHYFVTALS